MESQSSETGSTVFVTALDADAVASTIITRLSTSSAVRRMISVTKGVGKLGRCKLGLGKLGQGKPGRDF